MEHHRGPWRLFGLVGLALFFLVAGAVIGVVFEHRVGVNAVASAAQAVVRPALDQLGAARPTAVASTAAITATATPVPAGPDLGLITEAWRLIDEKYVDRSALRDQRLTYGALGGMLDALGDTGHTTFLTPAMVKAGDQLTAGEFEGIGAQVETKDGHVVIVAPMDGSPAQKGGVRPGDVILKVDGVDVSGLPIDEVVGQIMGPAGTRVTLVLQDSHGGQPREITLTRARIQLHNVTWSMVPGTKIAHLRISMFSNGVTKDLGTALTAIRRQGATGIILDLRNNPGGLLSEAIGTVGSFLVTGNAVLTKDAAGNIKPGRVVIQNVTTLLPTAVLINPGTASAAEIVTGAMQDARRATVVGETTFGTGTVLQRFPLSDGSALMLAIEEWLTPDGRTIWHRGLAPNITVTLPLTATPLFPAELKSLTLEAVRDSGDEQLLRALQVLSPDNPVSPAATPQSAVQPVAVADSGKRHRIPN